MNSKTIENFQFYYARFLIQEKPSKGFSVQKNQRQDFSCIQTIAMAILCLFVFK
jgi:hypothetical protein